MKKDIKKKVLMLCTGGTIGMLPKEENDPLSPLAPASWKKIKNNFTALSKLSFEVETKEMDLIDSSDMNPKYWIELARKIRDEYEKYDGFVILHGTDTMSYTATALSFLLEHLGKPVIVTGSQLPLAEARNDAAQNLVTALIFAASDGVPIVPEVCVLFNNVLLRGNRTRKVSSSGFAGFDSPNYRALAEIGEHINVDTKLIRKVPTEGFFINEFLESNVMLLDIFPGISPQILHNVFSIYDLKGVVLRTYGTGNTPTTKEFLREIEFAIKKDLAVVNITQCNQGRVEMGLYESSSGILRLGVISGVDMTPETALVKMMFLLGQGYDTETVKEQMQKDICGEQCLNVFNLIYEYGNTNQNIYRFNAKQLPAGYIKDDIETASIRFDGVRVNNDNGEKFIKIAIFMNYPSADTNTPLNTPQCLGVIEKKYESEKTDCLFRCTEKVRQVISDPGRPIQLTVVSQNNDVEWDGTVLSIYTNVNN